jgi:hypothetical protein
MAVKRLLTVGFELASDDVEHCDFRSDMSLLDWDVILFRPRIDHYLRDEGQYQGKPSLSSHSSFRLREQCDHWRREIRDAVASGKTVVVFLPELQQVYIDTGQREYSGTGRNQKVTHLVSLYGNYSAIPAELTPVSSRGSGMKLAPRGTEAIAPYWREFGGVSQYKVTLGNQKLAPCLVTRSGDRPVGALIRSKDSNGSLVLLPDIDFYADGFIQDEEEEGAEEPETTWTLAAMQFGARMVKAVIALDNALRSTGEVTPEPQWASDHGYTLVQETRLSQDLLRAERRLEEARKTVDAMLDELKAASRLRGLLFEKGGPLERVIIEGLILMGFRAEPFENAESEFDVVFESDEGRLIGEAEGKDNKPVNIDKLRQLAMNLQEDLRREEVTTLAKGVLFGNAYRLSPVAERQAPFTEKCVTAAQASSTALVATVDLFAVVRSLSNSPDDGYAAACRKAILNGVGLVAFPAAPEYGVHPRVDRAVSEDAPAS